MLASFGLSSSVEKGFACDSAVTQSEAFELSPKDVSCRFSAVLG